MLIEVTVKGVYKYNEKYLVIVENLNKERFLPIYIGENEAKYIATALSGDQFERPMTQDLLLDILLIYEIDLHHVVIRKLEEDIFHAEIALGEEDDLVLIDARPSDGIALAVRTEAPIYVEKELFDVYSEKLENDGNATNKNKSKEIQKLLPPPELPKVIKDFILNLDELDDLGKPPDKK